jgi:phosphatidate cytidylyltransferase
MSTDSLGQNSVFLVYLAILAGILAIAAVVLAFLTFVMRRDVSRVWTTYGSWLVLAPLTFGVIYLGRRPTILLFIAFALIGFREFAHATCLRRDGVMTGMGYLLVLLTGVTAIVLDPADESPGRFGLYMALPSLAVALFAVIPILRNRTHMQLQVMSLAVFGFMCVGWMFLHLALLADIPDGIGYVLYLLLAVELSDVAAFTFGTLLGRPGRRLLRSQISPNKTWEGAIGALAVSMVLPWLLHFTFPRFGIVQLLLTGLIVGIGGQLGDLTMSILKREVGVKDLGSLIPGHGGMLDRIDSLIYTGPLFLHMIRIFDKHG